MNVSDAILKRASIRKWKPTPVEKEKIEKVLEAGRRERQDIGFELASGRRLYRVSAEPLRDAAGAVVGVSTVAIDVEQMAAPKK